jgi:hypothetical protein
MIGCTRGSVITWAFRRRVRGISTAAPFSIGTQTPGSGKSVNTRPSKSRRPDESRSVEAVHERRLSPDDLDTLTAYRDAISQPFSNTELGQAAQPGRSLTT